MANLNKRIADLNKIENIDLNTINAKVVTDLNKAIANLNKIGNINLTKAKIIQQS